MQPIKQYGINHKTFQVEVNPNLSAAKKEEALKQYLLAIKNEGTVTVKKESLFDNYWLYSLSIAGYSNRAVEVRIDKRDACSQKLMNLLENISQLTDESIQQENEDFKQEVETNQNTN
ncbi:MAG TPA: hypothetical protein DCY20_02155, partial [Firmicutes bacterium]|nr:hypothetical protein [Bacillota bacterium]